jgi:hypothetical protein
MPSTITHTYFCLDIYNGLEPKIKDKLSNHTEFFKTFGSGPDLLYFHPSKHIRDLGGVVHRQKSKDFFINLIKYIKDNNLENNYEIVAFLYGFIAHYVLDSTVHPYVFYKTGVFNKNNPLSYKYSGMHADMENSIDLFMIQKRTNLDPKKFKGHQFCFNINNASIDLYNAIDYVFLKTFGEKNIGKMYLKSSFFMKWAYYMLKYDPLGCKKRVYKVIDRFTSPKIFKTYFLSLNIDINDKTHYLNLEKKQWCHPTSETEIYHHSFYDLYSLALKEALKIINELNKVLYGNNSMNILNNTFLNLSYISGKNCDLKLKLKYFEF